jgi:hypothetical protein
MMLDFGLKSQVPAMYGCSMTARFAIGSAPLLRFGDHPEFPDIIVYRSRFPRSHRRAKAITRNMTPKSSDEGSWL